MLDDNRDIEDFDEFSEDDIGLQDDDIYEINDNVSNENFVIRRNNSSSTPDYTYAKRCSSLNNDLEAMMYSYAVIIDCLSSACFQRSKSAISHLKQLLQSIPDFSHLKATKLEYLCQAAKLIYIDCENYIIIRKYSVLKDWYLCLEGCLRQEDSCTTIIRPGGFIGTDLWGKETLISDYDLYSNCDNCKLLVISKSDLETIHQSNKLMITTSDHNQSVILAYEACTHLSTKNDIHSYVLIKGTVDVLISHLFSNHEWVSGDFVEDFFLTKKLFLNSTKEIRNEIANSLYLENENATNKFTVLIRWISQHYPNFEKNRNKLLFIEEIIQILKNQNNYDWLHILYECCSDGAIVRHVKERISLMDYVVPVQISDKKTMFYISRIDASDTRLREGDVLLELDGKSAKAITLGGIKTLCEHSQPIEMTVKNDLLGYHEHVLKDLWIDSASVHSTPTNTLYSHGSSDKVSDATSLSANESDTSSPVNSDKISPTFKRPVLLKNLSPTYQSVTPGQIFKNPKYYTKSASINGIRKNSDITQRIEKLQNRKSDLVGSIFSISRFPQQSKSKRRRRSVGSNVDLIKSFSYMDISENISPVNCQSAIRVNVRDLPMTSQPKSPIKSDLRYFHIIIEPSTTVTEIIVRTLLKLNLSSAKSSEFFFVEIKIDESTGMMHEKSLHYDTANLIDRLTEHSRFYLKHRSFVGESLILPSDADKMREDFKTPSILQLSISALVVRLFLRSYKLLCKIQPDELVGHVAANKSTTLKYNRDRIKSDRSGILEYMHLSDFYKYWVITEVCAEDSDIGTRASIIRYFINLALKAMYIGHIDLFFSIISGLESTEVLRLNMSWDKVPKHDKKLLQNLETTLNVSGNMRNLRSIHQRIVSPLIPVTAMVIKDLTMLEETNPTYTADPINGLQPHENLVNFDKMTKMSKLARIFVNSICSCVRDKSVPVKKHNIHCSKTWENRDRLEQLLQKRLENQPDLDCSKLNSSSHVNKLHRKHSFNNGSIQGSLISSLGDSVSSLTSSEEMINCQIFERQIMTMKVERYLKTLEDRVIIDEFKLSEMSLQCEQNIPIDDTTKNNSSSSRKSIQEYEDYR